MAVYKLTTRLLTVALLLIGSAFATPVFVNGGFINSGKASVLTANVSLNSPTMSGDALLVFVTLKNTATSVTSVSDGINGYTFIGATENGTAERIELFAATGILAGASSVHVQLGAKSGVAITALEYAGVSGIGNASTAIGVSSIDTIYGPSYSISVGQSVSGSMMVASVGNAGAGALAPDSAAGVTWRSQNSAFINGGSGVSMSSAENVLPISGVFTVNGMTGVATNKANPWSAVAVELLP